MQMTQSRRDFLASASMAAAGAAGIPGARIALAAEPPPETTRVRLATVTNICIAPTYIAAELLRAEGFTDVRYIPTQGGFTAAQMIGGGEIDFGMTLGAALVAHLDAGAPLTVIGGVHSGCYELFARQHIQTITDLKGKSVGIQTLSSSAHLYLSIMAAHVGLNPQKDINWVTSPTGDPTAPMELYADGRTDAFLAFPPEPQELRARGIERVIIKTATDRPWSQYFCCMLAGNREFVRAHPVATKRVLRAILKAADLCSAEPERAARQLVDGGVTPRLDFALQTMTEVAYDRWREYDAEDTIRFYALQLREAGMITSTPNQLIAESTDWRFLDELKRELKA
jgi:NitT/TauT family transport system substrate-binding protein